MSKMKNKLTYFSGIGVIVGTILLLLSLLISKMPFMISCFGMYLFIISICLMLASTGNKDNISILFSGLTVIGVIIFTIFRILMTFNIIDISITPFSEPSISTQLFFLILITMIGSASLTMLTSTVSDNGTIRVLRNAIATIAVGIAILYILGNFLASLAVYTLVLIVVIEIIAFIMILFLIVLDKQESIETIKALSMKCSDFQKQTKSLQQELEKYKQQEQINTTQINELSKSNQELKANANYYNQLYVELKQENLYNNQQSINIESNQLSKPEVVDRPQQEKVVQPSQNSPVPTINIEKNNI